MKQQKEGAILKVTNNVAVYFCLKMVLFCIFVHYQASEQTYSLHFGEEIHLPRIPPENVHSIDQQLLFEKLSGKCGL